MDAYEAPRLRDKLDQQDAVVAFRDKWVLGCMKRVDQSQKQPE